MSNFAVAALFAHIFVVKTMLSTQCGNMFVYRPLHRAQTVVERRQAASNKRGALSLRHRRSTTDRDVPVSNLSRLHDASSAGDLPASNKVYTGALYEYVDYDHLCVYTRDNDDASPLSEEDCVVVVASSDVVTPSRLSVVDITPTVCKSDTRVRISSKINMRAFARIAQYVHSSPNRRVVFFWKA